MIGGGIYLSLYCEFIHVHALRVLYLVLETENSLQHSQNSMQHSDTPVRVVHVLVSYNVQWTWLKDEPLEVELGHCLVQVYSNTGVPGTVILE
jgi:hypothetical protein